MYYKFTIRAHHSNIHDCGQIILTDTIDILEGDKLQSIHYLVNYSIPLLITYNVLYIIIMYIADSWFYYAGQFYHHDRPNFFVLNNDSTNLLILQTTCIELVPTFTN